MDEGIPANYFWSKNEEEEARGKKRKRSKDKNRVDGDITDCEPPNRRQREELQQAFVADALGPEAYTVGIICALTVEKVAACCFLDKDHPRLKSRSASDNNDYTLGQIGEHNVVIAGLPLGRYGTTNAAIVARDMVRTFPNIRFGLMVGIGGGAPSEGHDIRLGDIVVGISRNGKNELLQYDFGKTIQNRKFQPIETRNNTPLVLQNAVGGLEADYNLNGHQLQKSIHDALKARKRIERQYKKPDAESDVLYRSDYLHTNESGGVCSVFCGNKSEHIVRRPSLSNNEEDDSETDEISRDDPTIHYGLIASANQLMKNAEIRDSLAKEAGVVCFEMEAAGLQDHFPCLVIRGICDYSDTHKNDRWHGYAAISAAAYAKDLLNRIPPSKVEAEKKIVEVLSSLQEVAKDHRDIVKDGLVVAEKSLKIQQTVREQEMSDRQKRCLHLFRLTKSTEDVTYEWYKNRVEERVEGTCKWFLRHAHFQEWAKQDSGPLLVSADPGCGKSVLAKYLIDHVLRESATVCYFFFKDQDQNTARQALCALLHQLFSQKPALIQHAMKQYEQDGKGLVNSTKSLWKILGDAVQDSQAGPVIVVLDALDECAKSEFEDLMRNIESQSRSCHSSPSRLRYFLTSRPYEQIMAKFRGLLKAFPRIHIPGEEESEAISQEVNLVISYRAELLAEEIRLPDKIRDDLVTHLTSTEHRTYLWVHLVFDYLKSKGLKKTKKGIESATKSLPTTVNQAYERILAKPKDLRDQVVVRRALAIILAANRPLTLSELNLALEIDETTQTLQDVDLEREEDFKSRLRSWCGLFVSVNYGKVYFLHQTAREFLLADPPGSAPIPQGMQWQHSIAMRDAHKVLAECCVRFLSLVNLDETDKITDFTTNHALLDYSARFWPMHFQKSCFSSSKDNTISHLALTVSDPKSRGFLQWSRIHWNHMIFEDPRTSIQLVIASFFGHDTVVKLLLDKGADVNAQGGEYSNALYAASFRGHEQVVKMLLDKGAEVNAQGGLCSNALQAASLKGNEQVVKMLLDKGADVNAQGGHYSNALQAASLEGHRQVVKMLLDEGANINAQSGEYSNALYAASIRGHKQVTKLLLDKGADVNAQVGGYGNALQAASDRGYEQVVKMLLDKGADVNAQGGEYSNALYAASFRGHEQVVKMLLDKGAEVNAQGGKYGNALKAALARGHEHILKMLVVKGLSIVERSPCVKI